jgi:predicted GNAT family acetyltransferase
MSENKPVLNVTHNPDASRFEVRLGDEVAVIEYQMRDGDIALTHTEVPPAFEGMGIGGKLAQFALEYAQDAGLMVQAECPFVAKYVGRHPEYQPITRSAAD